MLMPAGELSQVLEAIQLQQAALERSIRGLLDAQEERLVVLIKATRSSTHESPSSTEQTTASVSHQGDSTNRDDEVTWAMPGQPEVPFGKAPNATMSISRDWSSEQLSPGDTDDLGRASRSFSMTEPGRVRSMNDFERQYSTKPAGTRLRSRIMRSYSLTNGKRKGEPLGCLRRSCLALISTSVFEWLVSSFIIINAIVLGFQADWAVRHPGEKMPRVYEVLEVFFVCAFSSELLLRMIAAGSSFFYFKTNPDIWWNIFDLSLVLISLSEKVLQSSGVFLMKTNITRILRLSRLVRAMRLIRIVRFFTEIRVMVLAIGSSIKLLFWASLLLTMLMYLFAVLFMQIAEEELTRVRNTVEEYSVHMESLKQHWGSLAQGIYTLYLSITGGVNWGVAAEPLMEVSPWFAFIFCTYMAIAVFCVLNTVTGIFVEKANAIVEIDKESFMWHEIRQRKKFVEEVRRSFTRADTNGNGKLSWEEFSQQMLDVNVQTDLKALGIDVLTTEPEILFDLFDFDGDGFVEIQEFATGVQKLHGKASAIDVAALKFSTKFLRQDVEHMKKCVSHLANEALASHASSNPPPPTTPAPGMS